MSLRNGMWHDLQNGIIILAEWHNYAECNFLKINYTKKARQFFKRSRIVKHRGLKHDKKSSIDRVLI